MDLKNLKSVFIIAEIGQNHQGDIQVAKDVIKVSALCSPSILIMLPCFPSVASLIKLICLHLKFQFHFKMIREAARAGVDCVKFQKSCLTAKFTAAALKRPYESPNAFGRTYGEHKEFLEFTIEQFWELKDYAESCGLVFSASAMDVVRK